MLVDVSVAVSIASRRSPADSEMHLVKPIDALELIVAVSALAPRRMGA